MMKWLICSCSRECGCRHLQAEMTNKNNSDYNYRLQNSGNICVAHFPIRTQNSHFLVPVASNFGIRFLFSHFACKVATDALKCWQIS